ncbi:hypothetical protein CDD83_4907 [Cordyceps sp. RAO-2017]|nr:hypothetical protein CDD83_4907 [Cordyceps sp. RAO-2017]
MMLMLMLMLVMAVRGHGNGHGHHHHHHHHHHRHHHHHHHHRHHHLDDDDDRDDDDDDDDGATAFASDLGGDTTEDEPVPPRKVSSSDALRALSRTPLEEGVVWTVVNADSDIDDAAPELRDPTPAATALPTTESPKVATPKALSSTSSGEVLRRQLDDDDDDESSDDGFLAMAQTRSSRKRPPQPTADVSNAPIKPSPDSATTAASPTNRHAHHPSAARDGKELASPDHQAQTEKEEEEEEEEEEDEEGVFYFETSGSGPPHSLPQGPEPVSETEEAADDSDPDEETAEALPAQAPEALTSMFATSPAVPIRQSWGSGPSTVTPVKFRPGSLGSYKGRPLMMPIVRDPELLEQANSEGSTRAQACDMGDRIAMEEGSPPRASSTPFSFRERFMMEELMERAKSKKDGKGDEGR